MTNFPFQPSPNAPFQFSPTLDGNVYNVIVTYNLWGFDTTGISKRPYINVYDLSGNLIVSKPMIASPLGYDFNLIWGYFMTSTMVYRISTGNIEVSP